MQHVDIMLDNSAPAALHCFHCGEAVPDGLSLHIVINGQDQPMCCRGCRAVAETIINSGLADYYRFRTHHTAVPKLPGPDLLRALETFDNHEIRKHYVTRKNGDEQEACFLIEGIVCPACVWLNEQRIRALPGVVDVKINYTNNRATVRWDSARIQLSSILRTVADLGYAAHPFTLDQDQFLFDKERKAHLLRIGIAGFLGMQVMMNSIVLYTGEWDGIDPAMERFFHWFNLILTTPVVIYAGQPFFAGAWRDIKLLRTGMDVPVALGIGIAWLGCLWSTVSGHGAIYYDSIVMFIFLLLAGRYFEFMARKSAREHLDNISRIVPATAVRLRVVDGRKEQEIVPVVQLQPGDQILVRAGATVPADGVVTAGQSTVNESLLTGESLPVKKQAGMRLIASSTNIESPLEMSISRTGGDTVLSRILRLILCAQSEKPMYIQMANRIASWFVFSILIIAVMVAWYWWNADQARWLPITLSVLVATCPCALSLAAPVAVTAAITRILKLGIAVLRPDALEKLFRTTHFIFDKTGTLTFGRLQLESVKCLSSMDNQSCLQHAAALEINSEHPIGIAIMDKIGQTGIPAATEIVNVPGEGISGLVEGNRFIIGTLHFVTDKTGIIPDDELLDFLKNEHRHTVLLAGPDKIHCIFSFVDEIRPGARELIGALRQSGKKIIMLSGDRSANVTRIGKILNLDTVIAGVMPEEKLDYLKTLRQQGAIIAMTGDGVNDAPVLACADVAIAMGSGTDIAKVSADMVLLNDRLDNLLQAIRIAGKSFTIIRQNILWAIGYNLLILPSAAMGYISPWMAALGMSLSSLAVIGNATRLNK